MDYKKYSQGFSPSPTYIKNIVLAFFVGGAICELGYLIQAGLIATGMDRELAGIWSTVALICGAHHGTGMVQYPGPDRRSRRSGADYRVCEFYCSSGDGI